MEEIAGILNLPVDLPGKLDLPLSNGIFDDSEAVVKGARLLHQKSRTFEGEIHRLGLEMHSLQAQSASIHQKLESRESVISLVEPMLRSSAVPLSIIEAVEGDIGPSWVEVEKYFKQEQLADKSDESSPTNSHTQKFRKALLSLAISRARTFFVAKLRTLRRPGVDAQVVQRALIGAHPALTLLDEHAPRLASALRLAYRNTIRWYYTMLFGKYGRWLGRQPLRVDTVRLLGTYASSHGNSVQAVRHTDVFSVGARPAVLLGSSQPLPMTAVPPTSAPYFPLETLIHSLLGSLSDSFNLEAQVDLATPELTEVFRPVLAQYGELIKNWLSQSSNDVFGLLLTSRLIAQATSLPEDWRAAIQKQVLPLAAQSIASQAASIEQAALKASVAGSGAGAGPHLLTQLLSSYLSGVLQLGEKLDDEVVRPVRQLANAYEMFVSKLAAGNELVLHNNFFVMAALLGDIDSELARELTKHFQLLVDAYSQK